MIRSVLSAVILSMVCLLSASAYADSGELMNFAGLGDLQPVSNFYNGSGISSTPNYGVTFSSNFFGLKSVGVGGSGNFAIPPLGAPAIFINGSTGSQVIGTMNVPGGFSTGLNFFFTAGFVGGQTETVKIWSGANGTGTVLATIILSNNNGACTTLAYCTWSVAGTKFSGTAMSVTFSGPANELGLTDITIGSSNTAIPEPSSLYLLGTGIAGISLSQLRRLFGASK